MSKHSKEAESEDGVSKPLAAVMNSGTRYVVYRGKMTFHVYDVIEVGQERDTKKVEKIDLVKEIQGSGHEEFTFDASHDEVMDLCYINKEDGEEESHLRVYLMVKEQHYFADINLKDSTTTLTEASLFEDQSVFKL